jgi:cell fate (sporulation/competence/biofilm development) regulator YlbF (YheA/YmcA/DUF963 family)
MLRKPWVCSRRLLTIPKTMFDQIEDSAVLQKTRELCQAILDRPGMAAALANVSAFMDDAPARSQYQNLAGKGEALHRKQHAAEPITQEEISDFEGCRDRLMQNPVARGFMDAQEQMRRLHLGVSDYVSKTLELGRVPGPEDFHSDCCGDSCGCSH